MGKIKEFPRYNVICFRVCTRDYFRIVEAIGEQSLSDFVMGAVMEKVEGQGGEGRGARGEDSHAENY